MQSFQYLLFDFDGTIADTFSAGLKIINDHSEDFGYKKFDKVEIEKVKAMTPVQIIKEFKIPIYKIPFLLRKFQLELFQKMDQVDAFPGILEMIKNLKNMGYKLGIITSNSKENVQKFLHNQKILDFDFVHSEKNLFGKSRTIKNVLKKHHLNKDSALYIGDEVRDIDACRECGVKIASVTWGFNTKQLLEDHQPDFLVDTPEEFVKLLSR